MKIDWQSLFLTLIFGGLCYWFLSVAWGAIETGRLIPKSPKYPIIRDETPILFWSAVAAMVGLAGMTVWLILSFWLSDKEREK